MGDGGKKAPPLFFCGDIGFKGEMKNQGYRAKSKSFVLSCHFDF
jgi:hypothetical protein